MQGGGQGFRPGFVGDAGLTPSMVVQIQEQFSVFINSDHSDPNGTLRL